MGRSIRLNAVGDDVMVVHVFVGCVAELGAWILEAEEAVVEDEVKDAAKDGADHEHGEADLELHARFHLDACV